MDSSERPRFTLERLNEVTEQTWSTHPEETVRFMRTLFGLSPNGTPPYWHMCEAIRAALASPDTPQRPDDFDFIGHKVMEHLVGTFWAVDGLLEPGRSCAITALEEFYFRMTKGQYHLDWEELKETSATVRSLSPLPDTPQKSASSDREWDARDWIMSEMATEQIPPPWVEQLVQRAYAAGQQSVSERCREKLTHVADSCEVSGHTSRAKMFRAVRDEILQVPQIEKDVNGN